MYSDEPDDITMYSDEFDEPKQKCRRIEESEMETESGSGSEDGIFNLLPNDILLNIFKYIPKATLSNLMQVNHRFHRIGYEKFHWYRFDLKSFLGPSPQANLPMLCDNILKYYYPDNPKHLYPYPKHLYSDGITQCLLTPTEIKEIIKKPLSLSQKAIYSKTSMKKLNTTPHTATREDLKLLKTEVANQHLYELILNFSNLLVGRLHYSWPEKSIQDKDCRKIINGKDEFVEVVLNFSEYLLHSINRLEIIPIDSFRGYCKGINEPSILGCDKYHIENISDRLYCLIYLLQICKVFKPTKYMYRLVTQTKLLDTIIMKNHGIVD